MKILYLDTTLKRFKRLLEREVPDNNEVDCIVVCEEEVRAMCRTVEGRNLFGIGVYSSDHLLTEIRKDVIAINGIRIKLL